MSISYKTLDDFVIRATSGKIDFDGTLDKFSALLTNYEASVDKEESAIADAVDFAFSHVAKGGSLNMPAILHYALQHLNSNPSNLKALTDRVMSYVHNNADAMEKSEKKDPKTGKVTQAAQAAEPVGTRKFHIGRGKGGGVRINADAVAKPSTPVGPETPAPETVPEEIVETAEPEAPPAE